NDAAGVRRRNAPTPASCATPTSSTTTTSTIAQPDADGDGVPDALDRCPGGDDAVDLDRDGAPDACQELAVRASIDSFDAYASDPALQAVWTAWIDGADVTITRAAGQGEDATTAMRLVAVGPDPVTASTWASVSRSIGGVDTPAYDGIVLRVRNAGT